MRCFIGFGVLLLPLSVLAVVPGSVSDTNTSDFEFVGSLNGSSGVLVGPDLVLTAKHVGAGTFTLPGFGSFGVVGGSVINDPNSDLTVFRINTGGNVLPYATVDVSPMTFGDTVTMVGFGSSGTLNGAGTGYDVNIAGGIRRKGNAIYEFTEFVTSPEYHAGWSLISPLRENGQAALAGGDSGGGWFRDGKLVGTNAFIGDVGEAPWYIFSQSQTSFFVSGAISMEAQADFLRSSGVAVVPEPASLIALGLGVCAMLRRRRRAVS